MSNKPLIDIFVNKHFEVEPFMAAMITLARHYNSMPLPSEIHIPSSGINRMALPRASYRLSNLDIDFDIWCIEDLMGKDISGSNSQEKFNVLPPVIADHAKNNGLRFVISVSTAESTLDIQKYDNVSLNGSVLFGDIYTMFDVHSMGSKDPDPQSGSYLEPLSFHESNVNPRLFTLINKEVSDNARKKFWEQFNRPAQNMLCQASESYVSIGVINVTNYKAYPVADKAAYDSFVGGHPACIETTHGVVNMSVVKAQSQNSIPVLFASPITDRYLHFDEDVGSSGMQNYIAGYNAGIAVGELLMAIHKDPSVLLPR